MCLSCPPAAAAERASVASFLGDFFHLSCCFLCQTLFISDLSSAEQSGCVPALGVFAQLFPLNEFVFAGASEALGWHS